MKKKIVGWSINGNGDAQLYTRSSYILKNLFGFLAVILLLLTMLIGPR